VLTPIEPVDPSMLILFIGPRYSPHSNTCLRANQRIGLAVGLIDALRDVIIPA